MYNNLLLLDTITIYSAIIVVYIFTILGIIGIVISENRNPVKSLAWITVLLLLPIIGLIIYLFFGRSLRSKRMISRRNKRKLRKRESVRRINLDNINLTQESKQVIKLGLSLTGSEYIPGNNIDIYTSGKDKFKSLITDLSNAIHYINLQYYIFENDVIGNQIKDLLIKKAKDGVKVRVIYDHVGCFNVKKSFYKEMIDGGIDAQPFLRVNFPQFASRLNWRNHRKIIVIDGKIGYIGGMNIADRYLSDQNNKYWRDTHIRIEGPGVIPLQYSFAVDWNFMGKPLLNDIIPKYTLNDNAKNGIQIISSGPMGAWNNIALMLLRSISNARKCIYIQTPYFLPTESLLKALQAAALSKVDVRIMIPKTSDSLLLKLASYSYIKECLSASIKIYFYDKGMLHSKTMIIDDEFSTTGSANFDFRSMEHNFEANIFMYSSEINATMKKNFFDDLQECTRIRVTQWRHRHLSEKFKESLARLLSPIL